MANGIDIVIGAEVSGALQGLQKVEAATVKAGATINKLPAAINNTTQALKKLTPGSNEAVHSLINLSRVAQDAPYGFLGIANNINPLLESFQRLKASTGTTGGALKALGSSLLGGGGLGLAVGVVSSLFVVFGDKLFGSSKKAKEANEEYERLNKVIKEVSRSAAEVSAAGAASTVDERARVSILANAVRDQTKSYNERNNALNQLKEINKNYFGDLTLETASLATLTARVDEYSKALISAAIVKEFSSDIAKTAVETSKAGQKYNQLSDDVEKLNAELSRTPKQIRELRGSAGGGNYVTETNKEYTRLTEKLNEANTALFEQGQILSKLDDISTASRNGLSKAIEDGLQLKPLTSSGVKVNAAKVEVKPKRVVIDFNQTVVDKQIDNLLKYMFDKDVKFDFIAPILIPPDEVKRQATEVSEIFSKEFSQYTGKTKIDLGLDKAIADSKAKEAFNKSIQDVVDSGLENIKVDGLSSLGEAIGTALSGGDLSGVFSNFLGPLGSGIQSIGKQIIALSATAKAVKAALRTIFTNPAAAIIAGVGLIAVGSAIKGIASKGIAGARAMGGPVSAGRTYLVGEREPELFVPSQNGTILNQNQIAAMSYSGGGSSGGGRQIVRGQNIILAYARTNRAQNRLGRG